VRHTVTMLLLESFHHIFRLETPEALFGKV
jgi:hypothetical protein